MCPEDSEFWVKAQHIFLKVAIMEQEENVARKNYMEAYIIMKNMKDANILYCILMLTYLKVQSTLVVTTALPTLGHKGNIGVWLTGMGMKQLHSKGQPVSPRP